MAQIREIDRIAYLVGRRFRSISRAPPPFVAPVNPSVSVSVSADRLARKDVGLRDAAEAYKAKLRDMPPDELTALYNAERAKQCEEERAKADQEECGRFFNQPFAMADFNHWSKAAYWSLDEATALSFGKAPELVKWDLVKGFTQISPFAMQYARLRDLILRAQGVKQLYDPALPGFYIAWAKRNEISFPPDLEAAAVARGVQVADWKSNYDDLKTKYDGAVGLIAELKQRILGGQATSARLIERVAELEAKPPPEQGLRGKERESVLKLVIGMAVEGYRHDPALSRSRAVSEITSDIEKLGLSLSDDTVRKWLKEAAELLPGSKAK